MTDDISTEKTLTEEQFRSIFPERPFAIHFVERGESGRRTWIYCATFTGSYFTSDSDRLIMLETGSAHGYGETLGEALWDLVALALRDLDQKVAGLDKQHNAAAAELADLRAKLHR